MTNSTLREAAQAVIDADNHYLDNGLTRASVMTKAIDGLRAALAAPDKVSNCAGEAKCQNTIDAIWQMYDTEKRAAARLVALDAPEPPDSVPEGWKLLKDSTHAERSWPEDSSHENGNYGCECCHCGRSFFGHKRRAVCKVCATGVQQPEPDNHPEQPREMVGVWSKEPPTEPGHYWFRFPQRKNPHIVEVDRNIYGVLYWAQNNTPIIRMMESRTIRPLFAWAANGTPSPSHPRRSNERDSQDRV